MTELDDLGNYLSDAIENPSSENLSDLKKLISKLDKASKRSRYGSYVANDINNINYLLTNIHTTLSNLYGIQVSGI